MEDNNINASARQIPSRFPERETIVGNLSYTVEQMPDYLGEFEHIVLLAIARLSEPPYGVPIRREIEKRGKRKVSIGALYATLDRLEAKGYLESWFSEATPQRGGRSKRYFRLLPAGIEALARSKSMLDRMWQGVTLERGSHA